MPLAQVDKDRCHNTPVCMGVLAWHSNETRTDRAVTNRFLVDSLRPCRRVPNAADDMPSVARSNLCADPDQPGVVGSVQLLIHRH